MQWAKELDDLGRNDVLLTTNTWQDEISIYLQIYAFLSLLVPLNYQ